MAIIIIITNNTIIFTIIITIVIIKTIRIFIIYTTIPSIVGTSMIGMTISREQGEGEVCLGQGGLQGL